MESRFPDCPRSLKREEVKKERLSFLHEPHIAELTNFVKSLRKETGKDTSIPYFDPFDGGVKAECLFLFEAPGGKALDSEFVSRNNNDSTAENFFYMNMEVGLDRVKTVSWNIVPWALRENNKNRPPTNSELEESLEYLNLLLDLITPKVIVLCGKKAWKAAQNLTQRESDWKVIHSYHPSPQNVNTRPEMRDRIMSDILKAKSRLSE